MESEPNIIMEYFNKNKDNICRFLYFILFLFTLFISFLIIFQQLHINTIQFIYFYLTFSIGLICILGILFFQPNILSLIIFFIYFFYSFIFLFVVLNVDYSIYLKSIPIFTAMIIIFSIMFIFLLALIIQFSYYVGSEFGKNIVYNVIFINLFSILFIIYFFKIYDVASISTTTKTSYVTFYKIYVFIMSTYYFVFYLINKILTFDWWYKTWISILLFFMFLGLILYVIKFNGRRSVDLKNFLIIEYLPLFIFIA
jgi:hypothetical protein